MFRLLIVSICIAASLAAAVPYGLDERIVGGSTASPGQFPYQISLRRSNGGHTCGGSIINNYFILTAAHCVYGSYLDDFFVVVGTNSLSSGGQRYALSAGAYHGGYDPQRIVNDIAILKTSQPIQFNNNVKAIQLYSSEVSPGSQLTLSGWGLTSYPGNLPNSLQYASLTAIDINQCAQALQPGVLTNGNICTFTRRGQGACQGDSGGPLVYNGAQVGVVSWGRPCAQGYPDVFTKVAAYYGWVQNTMKGM